MTPFKVYAGGREDLHSRKVSLSCQGNEDLGEALKGLLNDAAAEAIVETAPRAVLCGQDLSEQSEDESRPKFAFSIGGRSLSPARRESDAVWSTSVSSMRGLARAMVSSLDVRIVGVSSFNETAMRRALELARAEGRKWPAIVSLDDPKTNLGDILESVRSVYHFVDDIEIIGPAQAALLIARDELSFDLLIAASHDAEILSAAACELAGSVWIASTTQFPAGSASALTRAGLEAASERGDAVEAGINAGVQALLLAGHYNGAARLQNALLKTLENNLHTDATALIAPYTTRLSEIEFVHAVKDRLGETPSKFATADFQSNVANTRIRSRDCGLRLVHSA